MREHVHAGDALHVVVGHTRWSAAVREVVRQWWDRDPHFTLVMLSLSSLGALFFRGGLVDKVVTGYSRRHVPQLHAEPVVPARLHVGRGRGRALVVPRVRAAARGRRPRAARGDHPFDRRFVDGRQRRLHRGRHAVRSGRTARAACRPTSRSSTRPSPTAPATSRSRRRCSKGCGVRSARVAARSSPSSGSSTTCARASDHVRIPAHRVLAVCEVADGRASRRSVRSRPARRRLRRGLRLLDRGARRVAARRLRRLDPPLDPRARRPGRVPRSARAPTRVDALAGQGRSGGARRARRRAPARPRRAAERVGARGHVRGAPSRRPGGGDAARTRCSPAPASPTSRRGSACSSRAGRGATCS